MQIQHQAARKGENFPVASFLLPKAKREPILRFYDFVRGLDDIADDASVPVQARESALQQVDVALQQNNLDMLPLWAQPYAMQCRDGRINPVHGQRLMQAFLQDTRQSRYESWQVLIGYCELSAAPVGRFLLELFDEHDAQREASDALCHLLQILNHLQDMGSDYCELNRIYLPQDMMVHYGVHEAMLADNRMQPPLRQLTDAVLQQCDLLCRQASALPVSIHHRGLRLQVRWIVQICHLLMHRLRHEDVLAQRVALSPYRYMQALVMALR